MIVIPLPPLAGVQLPQEPVAAKQELKQELADNVIPAFRSRSSSIVVEDPARSSSPSSLSSSSNSRRSTPRANSAAFARPRQQQQLPDNLSPVDPTTGVELDNAQEDPNALKYQVPVDVPIPTFGKATRDLNRDLGRLYEAVAGARRIAVICGAGVSVSSPANIPDFRSASGLFKKLKEQHPSAGLTSGKDLFDARLFSSESTSALFYTMIAELKRQSDEARPTIFHRLLKRLDEEGRLQRVYTQNIDGLEEKAGLTFGLGETADSTSTVRALGKRKRQGAAGSWSRSKSDSHLLASKRGLDDEAPMFPRTIPLHGTLQTLTCALCSHKVTLGDTSQPDAQGQRNPPGEPKRFFSPRETIEALDLLKEGEAVPCPKCSEIEETRRQGSLRSRGVGRMKTDVVLYGGQNEGAERVGECLQRDILGLRDPFEPPVPESVGETRARERKEKREEEKRRREQEQHQIKAEAEAEQQAAQDAAQVESELGVAQAALSICDVAMDRDDILAAQFGIEEEVDRKPGLAPIAEDGSVTFAEPPPPPSSEAIKPKRAARPARLKPLPPDLLIVAGTSLKVPGTKRIVREFAKACHARDARVYHSDSDDEEEESSEDTQRGKPRRSARSRSGSEEKEGETRDKNGDEGEESEGEDDPNAPIRTILFNYDFPVPSREWDDVFDVWVQGDLQRAALGVFPSREVDEQTPEPLRRVEGIRSQYSWRALKLELDEQRQASKKKRRKSAGASMSRSVSKDDEEEAVKAAYQERAASQGLRWARSKSESVVKRRRPAEMDDEPTQTVKAAGKNGAGSKARSGLARTTSKRGPASSVFETVTEEGGKGKSSRGSGKGKGGVGQKEARTRERLVSVVVMSSVAPPTPPPSTPSAESTPEPEPEPEPEPGTETATASRRWSRTSSTGTGKATGRTRPAQLKSLLGPGEKPAMALAASRQKVLSLALEMPTTPPPPPPPPPATDPATQTRSS